MLKILDLLLWKRYNIIVMIHKGGERFSCELLGVGFTARSNL